MQFKRALQLKPKSVEARANLAVVYLMAGKLDQSEAEVHRAMQVSQANAHLHYLLGRIYQQRGMNEKAVRELKTALQLDRNLKEAERLLNKITRGEAKG